MFWHDYAKTLRHASRNAITEGDFQCILARNCEGTEQLRHIYIKRSLPTLPVNSYKSSAFPLRDLKNVCIFSPYEL